MASILDVLNGIVEKIAPTEPTGYNVRYFAGWPLPLKMEAHLKTGGVMVSVYPYNVESRVRSFLNNDPEAIADGSGETTVMTELSRQTRWIQINIWAPNFTKRDVVAEAIKQALDATTFLDFPDQSRGWLKYQQGPIDDSAQETGVYRQIFLYAVEYATVKTETVPDACIPQILDVNDGVVDGTNDNSVLVDEIT